MVLLRRGQKWFRGILLVLMFLLVYLLASTLVQPPIVPGSVIPSPNFKSSRVKQSGRPLLMITYRGRMGNHMFEYGTLIGCAYRNNRTPIIPRNLDLLGVFKLPIRQGDKNLLGDSYYIYNEEKTAAYFNKTEKLKPYNVLLNGYYQSWKYFANVREELLSKHFVFNDEIRQKADRYLDDVLTQKKKHGASLVGIHVRRGDFVRKRRNGYTTAPLSYFYKAMNYFRRKYGNVLFIISSNDIFWPKDNLDDGSDVHYSENSDGKVDLAVLTSCGHMIISVGTYSWWAGYMVGGEVIYYGGFPKPNSEMAKWTDRDDYYPRNWIPMF